MLGVALECAGEAEGLLLADNKVAQLHLPLRAPIVVEIATTSGTARPSACGQAITSTVTTRSMVKAAGAPTTVQTTAVTTAEPIATSTR